MGCRRLKSAERRQLHRRGEGTGEPFCPQQSVLPGVALALASYVALASDPDRLGTSCKFAQGLMAQELPGTIGLSPWCRPLQVKLGGLASESLPFQLRQACVDQTLFSIIHLGPPLCLT